MELRKVLGLDDLGRELVFTRTSDSKGDYAVELITAFSSDGHCEVISCVEVQDEIEVAAIKSKQDSYRFYDEMFSGMTSVTGRMQQRGSSKSFVIVDEVSSYQISNFSVKPTRCNPSGTSYRATAVKHPKRKPQPNRGPVGTRKWQ